MTHDNSDYEKPRTKLNDLLPQPYQSDVNRTVFENLFNRFLTKDETQFVAGYIGQGNPQAITKRQIHEPTVHRQGYQLQPILNAKIGSIEWMNSWVDLQNEAERLGIDMDRWPEWGRVVQFNWAPPVDIDKIVHFQDYYWYDTENSASRPQYITIRSRCGTATALANFFQSLVDEYGEQFPIFEIGAVDGTIPSFTIFQVSSTLDNVRVTGDVTDVLNVGDWFGISGTLSNNGQFQVFGTPTYDEGLDRSTIPVAPGTFTITESAIGSLNIQNFDKLIINGDYGRLLETGFLFFFTNSTNTDLNDSFFTVVESVYDEMVDQTTVTIDQVFTDNRADGDVSLAEQLNTYITERNCQCEGDIGWDLLQWDDNPDDPLWGGVAPGDHATLIATISDPLSPFDPPNLGAGTEGQLWYDTTDDILYQYGEATGGWKQLYGNFSTLLALTTGMAFWDLTPGCGSLSAVQGSDQWITQNKWLHKTDVPNFSIAKKAQIPIIEYDWDLELNEWGYTNYVWQYRASETDAWGDTDASPELIEIVPLSLWEVDSGEIVLDERYGDQTDWFVPGRKFAFTTVGAIFEVESSTYVAPGTDQPWQTRITATEDVVVGGALPGDIDTVRPSLTPLQPVTTSLGDGWKGYDKLWRFVEAETAVPEPHQPMTPFIQVDETELATVHPSGDYEYTINYQMQNMNVLVNTLDTYQLVETILPGTTRSLRRRSLTGFDDIRVYVNDIRQFGNYDELEDVVLNVVSIDAGLLEITVDADVTGKVVPTDVIRIEENTSFGSSDFTVTSVAGSVITVTDPGTLLPGATATGVLWNTTTPIEDVSGGISYVRGVQFLSGFEPTKFDQVRIEVGEVSPQDFGLYSQFVRTLASNSDFLASGTVLTSLVRHRKVEQVKSATNQYPLFDIYNLDGSPAYMANHIFGFQTSQDADVNALVGLRIVQNGDDDFGMEQLLITEDESTMYAYRDYSNLQNTIWVNNLTGDVKFWDGLTWADKVAVGNYYIGAIESAIPPGSPYEDVDGFFWYDTLNQVLNERDTSLPAWVPVSAYDFRDNDATLQTIWKAGLNKEEYIPAKRDWNRRSLEEYEAERALFVEERAEEICAADLTLAFVDCEAQADIEWLAKQRDSSLGQSSDGEWVGDWETPDPLYYNSQHENWRVVTTRELLTHFTSIIDSQPKVPGFQGPRESMFHLIATDDVNYGLGGTIKEYNDGYDTFFSSLFVNNITPRTLFEFAHDQYESLLNGLKELYRRQAVDLLTVTTAAAITDLDSYVADSVILAHEENDFAASVYGDSTTFTEVLGTGDDLGVRNWIATLVYFSILHKVLPQRNIDATRGINEIVHHDGHRHSYFLDPAVIEFTIQTIVDVPDPRTIVTPGLPAEDTFGRISTDLPPNNITEFETEFNTDIIGRQGVYWYTVNGPDRVLRRLNIAAAGDTTPSSSLADGSLWMDMNVGVEVLRQKVTNPNTSVVEWEVVQGLTPGDGRLHNGTDPSDVTTATVSAWEVVNLDDILSSIILEVETRLYQNAPDPLELVYDFSTLQSTNALQALYTDYLEEAFLDYANQSEIVEPFANADFDITDAFTWNYKFSTPGTGIEILDADSVTNSFVVAGDQRAGFDPCQISAVCPSTTSFFIKNSVVNDGTWNTISSTGPGNFSTSYDGGSNTTTIFVDDDVDDGNEGIIYKGTLPSSANDGSESGGDWRDYYQKLYGTPYPHLEPWKLQEYDDKPSWWDAAYLNDDPDKWGTRRWKYKHGWSIVDVDDIDDTFAVDGDWVELFITDFFFSIDRSIGIHDGTYNVDSYLPIVATVTGDAATATIAVDGNHTLEFYPGLRFAVTDGLGNLKQTFTVISSTFTGPPDNDTIILVEEEITDATGFVEISGSTYDPDTNVTTIRVVEDITNAAVEGRLLYAYGMWENIRIGVIPPLSEYPNGIVGVTGIPSTDSATFELPVSLLPSFNYFSVNIDNVALSNDGGTTNYGPDSVFPPFFDITGVPILAPPAPFDRGIRSVFLNFNIEIVAPGADFVFGDRGTEEWEWFASSQYLYDQLTVAFRMDPLRLTNQIFGFIFEEVGCLQLDQRTQNTPCHCRTDFHGEVDGTQPLQFNGTNQWYVNYNRFSGFDVSYSDFRTLWVDWTAPLTYQFSSYIDTPTLQVAHRFVSVSEFDYNITSKISRGVEDYWLDAFQVALLDIPPALARYDNQGAWVLGMTTNAPVGRVLEYYDVYNFQFAVDPTTSVCTLYKWNITDLSQFNATFSVPGNQTYVFTFGLEFDVVDSTGNDGTYSVISSAYNATSDETIIEVDEVALNSIIIDGSIVADFRTLPWETGTQVWLSSSETFPTPLQGDTSIGTTPYFIEVLSDTTFRLARTKGQATAGQFIEITSNGRGDQYVGQINSTFRALNGQNTDVLWRHYVIDKSRLLTTVPPFTIQGMQNWIDFIDGYSTRATEDGWVINADGMLKDPSTGVTVGWQIEQERFINFAYGLRASRRKPPSNRWEVSVSVADNEWTFEETNTNFITGAEVNVTGTSLLPTPFVSGLKYYMIRDSATKFRLAATSNDAQSGNAITITGDASVDQLFLSSARAPRVTAIHRVNPFRDGIWFRPTRGIVSNMLTGPSADIRESQLLFDQYGTPLTRKDIRLFREDRQTNIDVADGIPNTVEPSIIPDPYNFIHLGGAHLFLDTYEHALVWNNRTSEDQLIYEPFIGLNVTKFEMQFNRHPEFTQRPNVGGHYLETFFNQGAELKRNLEASVDDMRNLYDVYRVNETVDLVEQGRRTVGYEGSREYLNNLNLNEKSQFIFWRGMIQAKGSINSVQAFVNSRRFIGADLDEFWAWKIADYGSGEDKEYAAMFVNTEDTRSNESRFEFARDADFCDPGFAVNNFDDLDCGYAFPDSGEPVIPVDDTFTLVTLGDQDRWYEQPNQLEKLRDDGSTLYWSLKPRGVIPITINAVAPTNPNDGDGWVEITGGSPGFVFQRWNAIAATWEFHGSWDTGETPYLRHNFEADSLTITLDYRNSPITESLDPEQDAYPPFGATVPPADQPDITITGVIGTEINDLDGLRPYIPFTGSVRVFKNGIELSSPLDYIETIDDPSELTTESLLFRIPLVASDDILIKYVTSELNIGTHYNEVNSNVVEFLFNELVESDTITNFKIWGNIVDKEAQNPAKLIDVISETALTYVPIWDPARSFHYTTGLNIVDAESDTDPAIYTETLTTDQTPAPGLETTKVYMDPWLKTQVGKVWMDTSNQDYIPYYDTKVFTNVDDRSRLWGQLADWAEVRLLEWVQSDVPPDEWDDLAIVEEGDAGIEETDRKSGRVVTTTFETVGANTIPLVAKYQEFDVRIDADPFTAGVATFTVDGIPTRGGAITSVDIVGMEFIFTGDFSQRLFAGMSIAVTGSTGNDGVYTVDTISADAGFTTITVLETIDSAVVDGDIQFFGLLDIYVNGRTRTEGSTSINPETLEIDVADLTETARVRIIEPLLVDDARQYEIDQGILQEAIQHSTSSFFDEFGLEQTLYYFWVDNKATKNEGQDIAPLNAEQGLTSIPTPYLFQQKIRSPQLVSITGTEQSVARVETETAVAGVASYPLGLPIAEGSTVRVLLDDTVVPDTDYTFTEGSQVVTLQGATLAGLVTGQVLTFEYLGMYVQMLTLPQRFVQIIIRGLRGVVNDDRRYVLRFTRDFTLRDNLDFGTTPLDLKNLHEEWTLIREKQAFNIDRILWDRATEAIAGYKLADSSIRVPSLERELYDTTYGTDTQYGLGEGQAFGNGDLLLEVVLADLNNPDNSFFPVDINVFFQQHSFDTPEEIIDSMNTIYTTFPFEDVNRIWFSMLRDGAFPVKSKYREFFKTSMIALTGVQPFQVSGAFDD